MKTKLSYLVLFTLFICCKSDEVMPDCSTVFCVAPYVAINLVDNTTLENFVIQNNIPKESILIYDSSQNQLDFSIFETTGILHINKKKLQDTIEIKITSELIATISYNTSNPRTNGCCDFGELQDVIIENKTFKIDKNVITIYL
ncbi:hypothetical protein [Mariniflexile sp.]|uniref:hypothetical protein n=1 Tax=Mariniflexile sp. TaxID=1979402 RepID=UPI003567C506